jgi:hypothetical protein
MYVLSFSPSLAPTTVKKKGKVVVVLIVTLTAMIVIALYSIPIMLGVAIANSDR